MEERYISVPRFIGQLDGCFNKNDMKGAKDCIVYWEGEARELKDDRGLLTVLNEAVGFYRRTQKKNKALAAMEECLSLVKKLGLQRSVSGATVYINAATTLAFFKREEEGLVLYGEAEKCYVAENKTDTYEYATLLNNKAGALNALSRYDEAEDCWKKAIEILVKEGRHDGEIAISLVMLAHLTFDRDGTSYKEIEALLDEAWEYVNSDRIERDGNYAYVLKKCAPSFDYFKRPLEAEAMREAAKEIYEKFR